MGRLIFQTWSPAAEQAKAQEWLDLLPRERADAVLDRFEIGSVGGLDTPADIVRFVQAVKVELAAARQASVNAATVEQAKKAVAAIRDAALRETGNTQRGQRRHERPVAASPSRASPVLREAIDAARREVRRLRDAYHATPSDEARSKVRAAHAEYHRILVQWNAAAHAPKCALPSVRRSGGTRRSWGRRRLCTRPDTSGRGPTA